MGKYATHYTDEELEAIKEQWLKDKKQVDEDYEGRYYNWDNEYIVEGRVVKTPPESKEVLEMADDDPRIIKMMENDLERWKKKYPNVTREEIDRKLDEMLASEKELRKKSQY